MTKSRNVKSPNWTDADLAGLAELYGTATQAQIAKYFDRTPGAIRRKIQLMVRSGELQRRRKTIRQFDMPSTAILLAKTCPTCGEFLSAHMFYLNRRKRRCDTWSTECRACYNRKASEHRHAATLAWMENRELLQEITRREAVHHGQPYTGSELDIIRDEEHSPLEIALKLGRTYSAILNQRNRLGICKPNPRIKSPNTDAWIIEFPNAMKALQEHFRRIGARPEDEWEWND